jgi:hypothetical protein
VKSSEKNAAPWFVMGLLSHLLLLLFFGMLSVPESWRGRILVDGYREGQPFGSRSVRENDALLLGLVMLGSVIATVAVLWWGWNRRRWFALGFAVPALWAVFYLLT